MIPGITNKEINGVKVSNIIGQEHIDFFDNINYVGSFLGDILCFLENKRDSILLKRLGICYDSYFFDKQRNIYEL